MKAFLPLLILAGSLFGWSALAAAEAQPAPPPAAGKSAANSSLAGSYSGQWKGRDDSGGTLRLSLKQDAAAAWFAESSFTFEGTEIPCTMKSVQVDGSKIELVFTWEIQGSAGTSKLHGERQGDTLEGKYETTGTESTTAGTWKVTRTRVAGDRASTDPRL